MLSRLAEAFYWIGRYLERAEVLRLRVEAALRYPIFVLTFAGLVFLYSGTLGFKHNPGLLLALAKAFAEDRDVEVVVNSQGAPADWLRTQAAAAGLRNLRVNPFQPYEAMSDVLASADVLVMLVDHYEFKAVSGDSVTQAYIIDTKGVWR